jgi:hypothetical protein
MTTLLVPWLLFPVVLGLVSLGSGLFVEWAAGARLPGALLLPAGLALVVVLGLFTTALTQTAFLTIPVVLGVAVAGCVLAVGRPLGRDPAAGVVAFATYLVYAAPVVLTGQATFTGYVKLDDTASFLGFTDQIMTHGRNLSTLLPSTFQQLQRLNIGEGYPVGTFVPLGIGSRLVGSDPAWTYQPLMAFFAVALALALFELLRSIVESAWLRTVLALVAGQAALLYAYALWGGIKEVAAAAFIGLTAAVVPVRDAELVRLRAFVPFAVGAAAIIGVLSVTGALWVALVAVPALVLLARSVRRSWRPAAIGLAVTALLAIPSLVVAHQFLHYANSNLLTRSQRFGNLIRALRFPQIFGIWPTGDFRVDPGDYTATALLIGVACVGIVIGTVAAVRRRAWRLPAAAFGCAIGAVILQHASSPWLAAKALASASPFVVLLALAGAGALVQSRRVIEGTVLGCAIAVGVLWSNAYGYSAAWIAPRGQLHELEQIGKTYAGQGPALMTEYQPYGVRHFLRKLQAEGASELRYNLVPLANGSTLNPGATADLDQFKYPELLYYRTLVLRTSGIESRPAAPYHLVYHGRFYDVWQRPVGSQNDVIEHLPLGSAQQPSSVPACAQVKALAQVAARDGAVLAAARTPNPVVVPLSAATFPAGWYRDATQPGTVTPTSSGSAVITATAPKGGPYSVWLGGFPLRPARVSIDGKRVGTIGTSGSADPGIESLAGNVVLTPGMHVITVSYGGSLWRPGATAPAYGMGPVVLAPIEGVSSVTYVQPAQAATLCGQSLDWLEVVKHAG